MDYKDFLQSKIEILKDSGFNIDKSKLNNKLFEFQKEIVKKALKIGRYAIFADTGLGKTAMQLEFANLVSKHTNKPVLILAPLAVSGQTINEGKKFDIEVVKYDGKSNIQISNYEQLDNMNTSIFSGIVLDESSILKNFTGKLRNKIIDTFQYTQYKLACTATPSPNDSMELGNHSEFLNYMKYTEMLSMFFVHDGGNTSKWKLKGHSEKDFYQWIGSWASVITDPGDLGYKEESLKFQLPELEYHENMIITPKKDNGLLFNETSINATDFNRELRETRELRLNKAKEIIEKNPYDYYIIWINHNEDEKYFRDILSAYNYRIVTGSDSIEKKEQDLIDFSNGKYQILITKGKIAGQGMNFQNCSNQIITGLDFSFEKIYQQVRRSYRFGQKEKVNIYLITTDTMTNVSEKIKQKENEFTKLRTEMKNIILKYGGKKYMEVKKEDIVLGNAKLMKGDCIERIKEIQDESIGFSIFSPPFSSLYSYSDHVQDLGNSKDYKEFFTHFEYLVKELFRVLQTGRNISVHCQNISIKKQDAGYIGLQDFRGDIIRLFLKCGFIFHSEVAIWKDPVIEMQRTKALGLLHKQVKKDSVMCKNGSPDYLVTFRKPGENNNPISGEFDHWAGDDTFKNDGNLSIDIWQRYASPIWMDINQSNTLQFRSAKDDKDEKHICPLQLDVIHRALQLWTNENDTVLTPFMGIGSEVYESLKLNRNAIGIELKDSYFEQAIKNIKSIIEQKKQGKLF